MDGFRTYVKTINAPNWNEEKAGKVRQDGQFRHISQLIRDSLILLPRRCPDVEEFADHCSNSKGSAKLTTRARWNTIGCIANLTQTTSDTRSIYDALCWYQAKDCPRLPVA